MCFLTTVVEEAQVRQHEPSLLPQLHASAVLSKVKGDKSNSDDVGFEKTTHTHTHITTVTAADLCGGEPAGLAGNTLIGWFFLEAERPEWFCCRVS